MNKKILVLGLGQNNFLSFLYTSLKKFDAEFIVTAPFYVEINKESNNNSWMYDNKNIVAKISILSVLKAILYCLFSRHFYATSFFILFVEGKFPKAFHFIVKQIQAKAFFVQNNNFEEFDTFHFHFMQYSYLRELFLVPKNKKIVCSFWGSDLLRTTDIFNFYFVKKALQKATIISCQSIELREIILSKFGRNLYDKIQVSMFPIEEKIYTQMNINYQDEQKIVLFKEKFNYSSDKINVLIGHSGSLFNNHLKTITALKKIIHGDKLHLIINLNYAISKTEKKKYKKAINEALQTLGCSYVILETFFVNEELAVSRLASDVFIHAPVSDALSSTMLELLYASNIVITGSWLPYKTFRKAQLHYHEIDDFSELGFKLDSLIENFQSEKELARKNKERIQEYFFNDTIVEKWFQILK
jgi:glycosyltransferase involved in cell wall biosynthesis